MNQLDKLVKNKMVLYAVLILTVTNVFGYLMTANYEAIVFFSLVYYFISGLFHCMEPRQVPLITLE